MVLSVEETSTNRLALDRNLDFQVASLFLTFSTTNCNSLFLGHILDIGSPRYNPRLGDSFILIVSLKKSFDLASVFGEKIRRYLSSLIFLTRLLRKIF